jgi:hypothetical protein
MRQITRIVALITPIIVLGSLFANAETMSSKTSDWKSERTTTERDPDMQHGPKGPEGPGGPMMMSPMPLGRTSETLQMPEIVRFAATEFPDIHQRLEKGRGVMPMQEVHEVTLFLKRMQDLQENNPEMYQAEKTIHQLEQEVNSLAVAVRKIASKDSAKQHETLKAKLGELFDLREKKREMEARQIEAELKNIRELLAKRKTNRDAIIQKRLKELTGENEGQEW